MASVTVPPGGSSTINGVLYQMLWTLLRMSELHAENCVADMQTGQITQATLRLEPIGGGGDLQEIRQSSRRVQQLKARSDEGPWSMTEVVEGVLPDLYLAVDIAPPETTYEFITEGRMGNWIEGYTFFQSLSGRHYPDDDMLAALDDTKTLKLGAKNKHACHTERSLFECIVKEVRKRMEVGKEPVETTHRKLWHLLGHFEFVGDQTRMKLQREIDQHLCQLVDYDYEVTKERDAMLWALARLAARGDADINDSAKFLAEHALGSIRFSAWPILRERSRVHLRKELERLGYHANEDVRLARAQGVASDWTDGKPILVISGESGQGKSWFLYALAEQLARGQELVILMEATGSADSDLGEAARICWHEIKNNDMALPLNRIAERLRKADADRADHWLYVLVDGVQNVDEALALVKKRWEDWGVRLLVSCGSEYARILEKMAGERCEAVVSVGDFTTEELQRYLAQFFGPDWPDIPVHVRGTLRRPLLAGLYRKVADRDAWRPTNEYELYQRYWDRIDDDERIAFPLLRSHLESLAYSILDGAPYPWLEGQLSNADLKDSTINSLVQVGWLRRTSQRQYEVWHNRLLNWAVAVALVNLFRLGRVSTDKFCSLLRGLYVEPHRYGSAPLGYVLMDSCWLLANSGGEQSDLLDQVLQALEDHSWNLRHLLYHELLPNLGTAILPALFKRLEAAGASVDRMYLRQVVDAITTFESRDVIERAISLLDSDNPRAQRAAMRILSRHPSARALNRLWVLHCSGQADPKPFLCTEEQHELFLYEDSFGALRSCVRLNPSWLETTIHRLENSTNVVDLAYLLANLEGVHELWRRCKAKLYRLVPTDRERCLASNIYQHADGSELDWLIERVPREEDLLGPSALRALIKLDPDLAVRHLHRLPAPLLRGTRRWCFQELLARRPEATSARFAELLVENAQPYDIALVFGDDENSLTIDILNILLDSLVAILIREISDPSPPSQCPPFGALMMLSRLTYPELVYCLQCRRQTALEDKLTEGLLYGTPHLNHPEHPAHRYGLEVLYKIGGTGFTKVVNGYLRSRNRFLRIRGLTLAFKRPDETTIELLCAIAMNDELWEDVPIEQDMATRILVYLGQWHKAVVAIMQLGLHYSPELRLGCANQGQADDTAVVPALLAIAGGGTNVGAVLALGLLGRVDQVGNIRSILGGATPNSELALACVISLGLLSDSATESVQLLIEQLDIEDHHYQAQVALLRTGSELALDALISGLNKRFNNLLAIDLLLRSYTRERATEMIRAQLRSVPVDGFEDLLASLLRLEVELFVPFLEESRARSYLREQAFADKNSPSMDVSKDMAIRGLSLFDPEAAFLAASKAMRETALQSRERYPYLLVEINAERAAGAILDHALAEDDPVIFRSMARALCARDVSETLLGWAASAEVERRLAASRWAAAMGRLSDSLLDALRRLTEDTDRAVTQSAWDALRQHRDARAAESLLAAVLSEGDQSQRWILLDSLLQIADPDDEHRSWPEWARKVGQNRPYLEQDYINDQLGKRRKAMADQGMQGAQKQDRSIF